MITSAAMRIGNNQLGCEPDDLYKFLEVLDRAGFPEWLDGTIDTERDDAWQIYLRETLSNYWNFLLKINKLVLLGYFGAILIAAMVQERRKRLGAQTLWRGFKGVLVAYFIVVLVATEVLLYFRNTPWMKDVYSGRTLMRPFPPLETTIAEDPAVSIGPMTLPNRRDVLFGGRLDARTIGAYNRWLEFHPGNKQFFQGVAMMGEVYRSYGNDLAPIFQQAVMDAVMEPILSKGGRFLQQDYRSGNWLEMLDQERDMMVQKTLFVGLEGPLFELRREYTFVLGDARFGYSRETAMARTSLGFLHDLDSKLFGSRICKPGKITKSQEAKATKAITTLVLKPIPSKQDSIKKKRDWISRWTKKPLVQQEFMIGEEVVYMYTLKQRDVTTLATIIGLDAGEDLLEIAFYGDHVYRHGISKTVPRTAVQKLAPMKEGSLVIANYQGKGDWFPGKIMALSPDGAADIAYDDDEYEELVERDRYRPK